MLYAKTIEEKLSHMKLVFQKLQLAGFKLSPDKCQLFKKSVKYLGFIVSSKGIQPDPDKLRAMKEWPTPCDVTTVRTFMGFANYYRKHVQGFTDIARPLHELTGKDVAFRWDDIKNGTDKRPHPGICGPRSQIHFRYIC